MVWGLFCRWIVQIVIFKGTVHPKSSVQSFSFFWQSSFSLFNRICPVTCWRWLYLWAHLSSPPCRSLQLQDTLSFRSCRCRTLTGSCRAAPAATDPGTRPIGDARRTNATPTSGCVWRSTSWRCPPPGPAASAPPPRQCSAGIPFLYATPRATTPGSSCRSASHGRWVHVVFLCLRFGWLCFFNQMLSSLNQDWTDSRMLKQVLMLTDRWVNSVLHWETKATLTLDIWSEAVSSLGTENSSNLWCKFQLHLWTNVKMYFSYCLSFEAVWVWMSSTQDGATRRVQQNNESSRVSVRDSEIWVFLEV